MALELQAALPGDSVIGGDRHEWHMLKQKTNMKKQKLDEIGDWLEFRSSLA